MKDVQIGVKENQQFSRGHTAGGCATGFSSVLTVLCMRHTCYALIIFLTTNIFYNNNLQINLKLWKINEIASTLIRHYYLWHINDMVINRTQLKENKGLDLTVEEIQIRAI